MSEQKIKIFVEFWSLFVRIGINVNTPSYLNETIAHKFVLFYYQLIFLSNMHESFIQIFIQLNLRIIY
ncbi:hypothetical protein BpHYR1_018107 [Brachionus plicatilis]|uniref:Uncharacterized protein n=1 Tax=Brachionus plicatilis TaxID=10195 RepID=A0A3M7T255_BRAPC|nr:hypothetical protein BpHYR1_018107 [Brachionus plicatilis]